MKTTLLVALAGAALTFPASLQAQDHDHMHRPHHHARPLAPIGVMGDHMHKKGEWMLSYRYNPMRMDGNRSGTNSLSPEEIVTTFANPNAPPANVRVVPTEMTMDMHMIGGMVGVTDWLTLSLMGMYMENEMDHITFSGMAGTNRRGTFTTRSSGWGDTRLSGLVRLYEQDNHHVHLNLGMSAPTGSIKEEDDVLAPNGLRPTLRLPYAMQLGSGTWDVLPGLTYTGHQGDWGWGAQYKAVVRLEDENDEGYSLGDKHALHGWGAYKFTPMVQGNVRVALQTEDSINGSDPRITAPVQTANPDNYGGESVDIGAGFNITPQGLLSGHQIGFEVSAPIYQDLNGVQMERDWSVTAGWIVRF